MVAATYTIMYVTWAIALLSVLACLALPPQTQLVIRQDDASSSSSSSSMNASNATSDEWTFTVTSLNQSRFTAQPYVSNGYIGARLPAVGVGFQSYAAKADNPKAYGQGWPIFGPRVTASMVAGFYDVQDSTIGTNFPQNGGEQVVSLLPSWPQLYLTLVTQDGTEHTYAPGLDETTVKNFTQSLSIRNGVVQTDIMWQPDGVQQPIHLCYTVLAHRARAPLGMMRLQASGLPSDSAVIITDALDGQAAMRTTNGKTSNSSVPSTPDFDFGPTPNRTLFASVQPIGVPNVTAYVVSTMRKQVQQDALDTALPKSVEALLGMQNETTASQSFNFTISSNGTVDAWKYVGIASTDAFDEKAGQMAIDTINNATQSTWDALLDEHKQEWERMWNEGGDIVLHDQSTPTLVKLQRQARASLFHLLSNTRRGEEGKGLGDNSIPPSGLTSDSYAGSIFWDAETFMFPSLSLLYPAFAEPILNYRHKVPVQAERNAQQYGKVGTIYPWVSARYQNCTGIGPCYDYEYHLNNDIALAHWQYYLQTQNKTFLEQLAFPIMQGVSQFWTSQVVQTSSEDTHQGADKTTAVPPLGVGNYSTLNMTEPDEYANHKDNGAFTNAGLTTLMYDTLYAAQLLNRSVDSLNAQNWSAIADGITLLRERSSNIVLEFEGFNSTILIKQADVPLLIYPLEYNIAYPEREPAPRADLDYYSGRTDPAGPAMTNAIYGIVSIQLDADNRTQIGPTCEGYTRLLQSGLPYEREFGQLSEQINDNYATNGGDNPAGGVNPAYTFLTGHGGLLQMYTHGFLGYRARNSSDATLHLDPNLPPQLYGGLTIKGVHHGQSILDIEIGRESTTVTHRNGTQGVLVEVDGQQYTVEVGSNAKVPTRTSATLSSGGASNTTNLALCTAIDDGSENTANSSANSVSLMRETHAGTNLASGANDGSNSTYFQPTQADEPSSLVIDLGKAQTFTRMHLNFGNVPPQFITVAAASNGTDDVAYTTIVDRMAVNISAPYDTNDIAVVNATVRLPTMWNTTDIDLSANNVSASRYVRLTLEGVATPQALGYGATLHEVQIF